jgi:WD40 repeat protein
MLKELMTTRLSTKEVIFCPGGEPISFTVSVVNGSDRFVSFQVELVAAGLEQIENHWYRLTPDISTKNPPGDRATFCVEILRNPQPGFVGVVQLAVRILSPDLDYEERQSLRLVVLAGEERVPLALDLPVANFPVQPEEQFDIPVGIANPAMLPETAIVRLIGVEPQWFPEGIEQPIRVGPKGRSEARFLCRIPSLKQVLSRKYPFTVEVCQQNGLVQSIPGMIQVLSGGEVVFSIAPIKQKMPHNRSWHPQWRADTATYAIDFANESNLEPEVIVTVRPGEGQPKSQVTITPETVVMPIGETQTFTMAVQKKRHWFGWKRKLIFEVFGRKTENESNPKVEIKDSLQVVTLELLPIFPIAYQVVIAIATIYSAWWLSWLNPANPFWGHQAAVNTVQFDGTGQYLISGGSDQMLFRWRQEGFHVAWLNQQVGSLGTAGKSVRVARFRPVNNDQIAAGLENGEIQLWSATDLKSKPLKTLVYQSDDRVFDLAYPADSRSLFSAHGSGTIVQWDLATKAPTQKRVKKFDFALQSIKFVGVDDRFMAVAGRFNQLLLWDLSNDRTKPITIAQGGANDYRLSLAISPEKPYLLASSDNQGKIQLWDLKACLGNSEPCQLLDEWDLKQSTPTVAISPDGCYFAAGGSDGRTRFWPLSARGDRKLRDDRGLTIGKTLRGGVNSVDIVRNAAHVRVAVAGDDTQVNLFQVAVNPTDCR